jgi:hypothetical protein
MDDSEPMGRTSGLTTRIGAGVATLMRLAGRIPLSRIDYGVASG